MEEDASLEGDTISYGNVVPWANSNFPCPITKSKNQARQRSEAWRRDPLPQKKTHVSRST